MTNEIVPIGKYKGQPIERLMADQPYSEWLLAQAWFVDRYAELAQLVRMGRIAEPQDTPEHNAMIARLIDQRDVMEMLFSKLWPDTLPEQWYLASFQQTVEPKGGDLLFLAQCADYGRSAVLVEAKPLIGDDFPSVIRQVKATPSEGDSLRRCVIVAKVEPTNLTLTQVQRQFELAGVSLVIEADLFADVPAWQLQRLTHLRSALPEAEQALAEIKAIAAQNRYPESGAAVWKQTSAELRVQGIKAALERASS